MIISPSPCSEVQTISPPESYAIAESSKNNYRKSEATPANATSGTTDTILNSTPALSSSSAQVKVDAIISRKNEQTENILQVIDVGVACYYLEKLKLIYATRKKGYRRLRQNHQ
jgi:hypothetical protein